MIFPDDSFWCYHTKIISNIIWKKSSILNIVDLILKYYLKTKIKFWICFHLKKFLSSCKLLKINFLGTIFIKLIKKDGLA